MLIVRRILKEANPEIKVWRTLEHRSVFATLVPLSSLLRSHPKLEAQHSTRLCHRR